MSSSIQRFGPLLISCIWRVSWNSVEKPYSTSKQAQFIVKYVIVFPTKWDIMLAGNQLSPATSTRRLAKFYTEIPQRTNFECISENMNWVLTDSNSTTNPSCCRSNWDYGLSSCMFRSDFPFKFSITNASCLPGNWGYI